ncbi:MAG: hypothetical protein ACJ72W_28690 [Actinoallomurus sp.]
MAVRAMTSASSGAGYGHPWSPVPNARWAWLPPASPWTAGRTRGSALAPARPTMITSPARIVRPPSSVSRIAQRPGAVFTGASSHSTSFSAWPTLRRPPERVSEKRSSVSMRRSALPIQWAVFSWLPETTTSRSWISSSSVMSVADASRREVTSGPGDSRLLSMRRVIVATNRPYASTASSRALVIVFMSWATAISSESGTPSMPPTTRTGRR